MTTLPNDPDYGDALCWDCEHPPAGEQPCPPSPCPPTNKSQFDQYKVVCRNVIVPAASVVPGVSLNPGRQCVVFANLNALVADVIAIRVHQSGTNPTVAGQTSFIEFIPGGSARRFSQSNELPIIRADICLVNAGANPIAVSITEAVGPPSAAPLF